MDLQPLNEQEQALADKDVADRQKMQSQNLGRRKKNPSKSRQGRAVQVNGALRNPYWTPPSISGYGRNPAARKHMRTYSDEVIAGFKFDAEDYAQDARESASYAGSLRECDISDGDFPQPDMFQEERKAQVNYKRRRRAECEVSRQLNRTWRAGAEESFTVEEVRA